MANIRGANRFQNLGAGNPRPAYGGIGTQGLQSGLGMRLMDNSELLADLLSPEKNWEGVQRWPGQTADLLRMLNPSLDMRDGESYAEHLARRQGTGTAVQKFAQTAADAPAETAGAVGAALRQGVREGGLASLTGPEDFVPAGKVLGAFGTAAAMAPKIGKRLTGPGDIADLTGGPKRMKADRAAADRAVVARYHAAKDPDWAMNGTESLDPDAKAISALDLNNMSQDEARQIAMRMNHLKRNAKTGQYIGAPDWVDTPEKLVQVRKHFDELVEAGSAGSDWYAGARSSVSEMSGNNRKLVDDMADQLAIYSIQADPEVNLGHALKSQVHAAAKGYTGKVRTKQQQDKVNKMLATGDPLEQGPKTGAFRQKIDPYGGDLSQVVNDIWHARNFGFVNKDGTPWAHGLSASQHAWITAETHLAALRANKKALGGKTDWDAATVQAAPWVYAKGRDLHKKYPKSYPDVESGVNAASRAFGEFFTKNTAYGTDEMIPGESTGHMIGGGDRPSITSMSDAERLEYTTSMPNFRDDEGRDLIFSSANVPTRKSADTSGAYVNKAGELETNPGQVSQPLVGSDMANPSGKEPVPLFKDEQGNRIQRRVDPISRKVMDAVGAIRGFLFQQEASAWQKPFAFVSPSKAQARRARGATPIAAGARAGDALDFTLPLERPITPDEMSQLQKVLEPLRKKYNADLSVSDTSEGVTIFTFQKLPRGSVKESVEQAKAYNVKKAGRDMKPSEALRAQKIKIRKEIEKELRPIMNEIFPDADLFPAQVEGNYMDLLLSAENEGTGAATRFLQEKVTDADIPLLLDNIDNNPKIRAEIGDLISSQSSWSKANGQLLRKDIMTALSIWHQSGLRGLFQALQDGRVLPAVAVPIIGGAMLMDDGPEARAGGA